MASAVLFTRNQSDWPQSRHGFMAETLISNPNSSCAPPPGGGNQIQVMPVGGRCVDPTLDFDHSSMNNALSMNQKQPKTLNGSNGFHHCGYVSFDMASMSRKEAVELRRRFVSELERVRDLAARIDGGRLGQKNIIRKVLGGKRGSRPQFPPLGRESKRFASDAANANCLKACRGVLARLMKHKHCWVFNSPVDIVGLGLHDYNQIVKKPMDLGTVKSNLGNNMYIIPLDFASDVRLTFDNAMLYNPSGHEVYVMAEALKSRFEEIFLPVYQKFVNEQRELRSSEGDDELQGSSWNPNPSPDKCCSPQVLGRRFDLVQTSASTSSPDPVYPPRPRSPMHNLPQGRHHHPMMAKSSYGRLPKPKARDPNKREMNIEEKQQLGSGLQSLPQEKMIQVIQIIRKRNSQLKDEGDEIELDIEAMDVETLWELDRFVTNWKKTASKIRRQSLVGDNAAASDRMDEVPETSIEEKKGVKGGSEGGDEYVDIGDDIPTTSFPPLEIEKDVAAAAAATTTQGSSSSTTSTTDSSSSSDSESGSSSGSDSDADVQSRRMSM